MFDHTTWVYPTLVWKTSIISSNVYMSLVFLFFLNLISSYFSWTHGNVVKCRENTDHIIFEKLLKPDTLDILHTCAILVQITITQIFHRVMRKKKSRELKILTRGCNPSKTKFLSQGVQWVKTTMEFANGGCGDVPKPQGKSSIRIWMVVRHWEPSSLALQGYCI